MSLLKWPRWKSCQLVRGEKGLVWVIPPARKFGTKRFSYYDTFAVSGLPTELARVNLDFNRIYANQTRLWREKKIPQDETACYKPILGFVESFGPLGFTILQGQPAKVILEGRKQFIDGDRIDWFLDHARNVALVLQLQGTLKDIGAYGEPPAERDAGERAWETLRRTLERVVKQQVPGVPTTRKPWWAPLKAEHLESIRKALGGQSRQEVAKAGRLLLAELLNPNLAGVRRFFDGESGLSTFRHRALAEAIYWQIADGWSKLRQCEECGLWFFADDDRRRFCPHSIPGRQSKCGKRYRMRELRQRRRSKKSRKRGK